METGPRAPRDRNRRTGRFHPVEDGRCGFCGQRPALGLVYRCRDCDRETCALCAVTVWKEPGCRCPDCAENLEE